MPATTAEALGFSGEVSGKLATPFSVTGSAERNVSRHPRRYDSWHLASTGLYHVEKHVWLWPSDHQLAVAWTGVHRDRPK